MQWCGAVRCGIGVASDREEVGERLGLAPETCLEDAIAAAPVYGFQIGALFDK